MRRTGEGGERIQKEEMGRGRRNERAFEARLTCSLSTAAWSQIPPDRFNPSAFWSPQKRSNTSITRGGFFLQDDIATFDAGFFTLPKAEVSAMDPQQRILIEVAYEAFESAGLVLPNLAGSRTGVYVGVFTHDYGEILRKDAENMPTFMVHGTSSTSMAGRLSWLWDLRGPSFALDTACSSGLVALHLAVQGLRAGEADTALVGGTNLLLSPDMFKSASSASFLAPDGRSKAFDESADGYGRGEGIGVIMLKRVEDAVRDGYPIRAVIRGTGCNQDGRTPGMTLPSSQAQAVLISDAYRKAGVDMKDVGYVEAHGTGTQAGDREETTSLSLTIASAKKQAQNGKLLIGSVKSNIGHLEASAGIAALIKTVLVLEHGLIPPTISAKTLNSKIPFSAWNLSVPTNLTPFPGSGLRRASVNSFGFCGTNAHAIIDDAYTYLNSRGIADANHFTRQGSRMLPNGVNGSNQVHVNGTEGSIIHPLVFALSAQDKDGIGRVKQSLTKFLTQKDKTHDRETHEFFTSLAHTLNIRRTHHQWKTYAVASTVQELVEVLNDREKPLPEYLGVSRAPRLGFVFTGQGAQWAGMGMELMAYPTFSASILAADRYLKEELGIEWSVEEELRMHKAQSKLSIAEYSQSLCTVIQVALVDLLREWGIVPTAMTGHSSGEIAAAYCLGALSREDAWKIASYRGIISAGLKEANGSMMAAGMTPEKASELIAQVAPGEVVVACINSPSSVTLSGNTTGIDKLLAALTKDEIFARKLQVDTAYHSHHMQAVASDYMEAILDIRTRPGNAGCVMQSSATGTAVAASELGPAHWVRNLTSPVFFSRAVQDLVRPTDGKARAAEKAVDLLVEIGPHYALQGPTLQSLKAIGVTDVPYLSTLTRFENGIKTCLTLAGDMFARSFPVDLAATNKTAPYSQKPRTLIDLPRYPWNHQQRYWAETRWAREQRLRSSPPVSLLPAPSPSLIAGEHAWRGYMRLREQPWIADHTIQGSVLYPAAGFVATAIEAAAQIADGDREVRGFRVRDVQLVLPIVLQEDHDVEYTIVLRPHLTATMSIGSTWTEFVISSSPDGTAFERNCLGLIQIEYADSKDLLDSESMRKNIDEVSAKCNLPIAPDLFYDNLNSLGLAYGPTFANVSAVRVRPGQSTGIIDVPDVGLEDVQRTQRRPHVIHPATLDAVLHTIFAAIWARGELTTAMIPKSIESLSVSMDAPFHARGQFSGICETREHGLNEYMADVSMEDHKTRLPVLKVKGLCCTKIAGNVPEVDVATSSNLCTKIVWQPHIDLLSNSELVASVSGTNDSALSKLARMISLLHHVNPAMTILEVAISNHIIVPGLEINGGVFATTSYQITCPENLKAVIPELLSQSGQNLPHKILDLEECLASQEFPADLIVANADGSEDSLSIIEALVKKLPAEGGRVCVISKVSANTTEPRLQIAGVDSSLVFEDKEHLVRIITRVDKGAELNRSEPEDVVILANGRTTVEDKLVHELEAKGFQTMVVQWADITTPSAFQDKRCISLVELDRPFVDQLSDKDFSKLKHIVKQALHVSWVVTNDADKPSNAMMTGALRVLHNEMPGLDPISIAVDASSCARPQELAALIVRVFNAPMGEREFQILDCIPHISRILPDDVLNDGIDRLTGPRDAQELEMMTWGEATANGRQCRLAVGKPGQLDSIRFEMDDTPESPLLEDEIEIEVRVSALNFRDVMSVMALLPNPTLGVEAAGLVRRVGSAVSTLQVSDRVALVGNGAHASVLRGKAAHAFRIPETMTFEKAAALPVVSYTAWYALVSLAKARKGQTALIHAGTGGVGQAALQLARTLGLEIFTTVSSDEKRRLVREKFGLPDDHIFGSRDLGFANDLMKMTNGGGVDIVLNSLAGEFLRRSWECLAPSGHFVEIGVKDIVDNTRLDMRPFMRGASFSYFNLKDIWDGQLELMSEIVKGMTPYLADGIVKPADPLVAYPVSDLVKAMRLLQAGRHMGKLVIQWTPDAQVPVLRSPAPPLRLDEGVFLLIGGMGGLGRSIARMLFSHGARKFCFLSRSAGTSIQARYLLDELAEYGAQSKVITCDVSDATSLVLALDQCKTELGSIRGVFQCAAVLNDALFANMTYSDWTGCTRPKVQGSQNLSDMLPHVDFFIMLSSYAGIFGNRGQANYAAGCGYQDALAYARRALGHNAVSVDLGQMRDVGGLAEKGSKGDIKEWEKVWGIREDKFLALMRLCMQAKEMDIPARVVTGVGTRAGSVMAGIKPPYYLDTDPRFAFLSCVGGGGDDIGGARQGDEAQPLSTMIPQAASVPEATSLVAAALIGRVAKMLDLPPAELDAGRFLHTYGVDSLAAIEIVNWALREVQARIAVFDVMAAVSITVFCERVAARSALLPKHLVEAN